MQTEVTYSRSISRPKLSVIWREQFKPTDRDLENWSCELAAWYRGVPLHYELKALLKRIRPGGRILCVHCLGNHMVDWKLVEKFLTDYHLGKTVSEIKVDELIGLNLVPGTVNIEVVLDQFPTGVNLISEEVFSVDGVATNYGSVGDTMAVRTKSLRDIAFTRGHEVYYGQFTQRDEKFGKRINLSFEQLVYLLTKRWLNTCGMSTENILEDLNTERLNKQLQRPERLYE